MSSITLRNSLNVILKGMQHANVNCKLNWWTIKYDLNDRKLAFYGSFVIALSEWFLFLIFD